MWAMSAKAAGAMVLLAWIACPEAPLRAAGTITVSAAVSLTDALQAAGAVYTASSGAELRFNFAGSNVLARQIASGAPVDLFISADEEQMARAERAGAIDSASRVPLVGNHLVLVTRPGLASRIPDVSALRGDAVRRLAIGDPAAVPAGVYARRYLLAVGLWSALEPRCVPVANARAALAAAASGSADAAFVYRTDARASKEVEVAFEVSGPAAPQIVYPAAITTRAPNRAGAARLLAWLQGAEARAIFEAHGFSAAPGEPR